VFVPERLLHSKSSSLELYRNTKSWYQNITSKIKERFRL